MYLLAVWLAKGRREAAPVLVDCVQESLYHGNELWL